MSDEIPQDPLWPQVGQSLGPWLILRHHDLEGSGDMFLAKRRDGAFEREVLITLQRPTPPGAGDDMEFLVERELQGRLDHPGIAKVLGAGRTPGGLPYLVTEYLDGLDIEEFLNSNQTPVEERLRYFQQVCQAVHHAHGKGIFGLNLQASNVHLMEDGSLRIVVFGLAQWNTLEKDGPALLGSRAIQEGPIFAGEYASPEQWSATKPAETSDVYSLGVLLYRLLTGTSPQKLAGLTPAAARDRVQNRSFAKASARMRSSAENPHAQYASTSQRHLAKRLAGDLDLILSKALARSPGDRYASALELSEDLDRHLAGQPIRARGPAPVYVLGRGLSRYRTPLALFLSVVLILSWALQRSFASSQRANAALIEARALQANSEQLGKRLRDLCVRFMTELGPGMQGRPGLEDARRYLLNVGAPLLDHLRGSGHEDVKLAIHICRSYSELAEADYISRDLGNRSRTPESSRKALTLSADLMAHAPDTKKIEAGYYYSRAVRSAIWFAGLTLDTAGGQQAIDNIPIHLQAAGLEESDLSTLAQLFLAESRRTFHASQLNFDKALDAWDLERFRTMAEASPTLLPFFEADYSRFASVRASDLIRAGRGQEALYELPTLVYQMSAEVASHNPPVLSLLGNETLAWINLAKARLYGNVPPGEAILEASRHLQTIRDRFLREPGAKLILVGADTGLGYCKLQMGSELRVQALEHLERAGETLQSILDQGARWPLLRAQRARIHYLRAQALFDLERSDSAREALTAGFDVLEDLGTELAQHSQVLTLTCSMELERLRQQDRDLPVDWSRLLADMETLRARGVSKPELASMEKQMNLLRQNPEGVRSK